MTSASFIAINTNAVNDLSPAAEPPCNYITGIVNLIYCIYVYFTNDYSHCI